MTEAKEPITDAAMQPVPTIDPICSCPFLTTKTFFPSLIISSFPVITTIEDLDSANAFASFSGLALIAVASTPFVSASSPASFVVLKNARADDRIGAIVKRGGSQTETIADSLGVPLGAAEYRTADPTGLIPFSRDILVNFAGSDFYKLDAGSWSSVSQSAYTDFGSTRNTSFAQLGASRT